MAVNIILRAIVSIFAIGIAMVAFMPAVYDLYYNQDLWQSAPSEALAVRDNVYATFLALPLMMIGAVFLWSYMSATRKDYGY
jgi:cytochrome bd-type quinol oxidase subunit 2|tara:strand:- start:108 stop:353 length:246 start_codon:yes stop_codon:yes gene_type:complete